VSTRKQESIPGRRVRAISREVIMNPNKGLNNLGSPNLIDNREWADLLNIEFDEGGVARKRMGFANFSTALTNARGLGSFITESINQVNTVDNGTFKYSTGTSWTSVATISFTADKPIWFTQARAKQYIFDETLGGAEWDGTTLSRPGTMPKAKFSVFTQSYHIASGVDGQANRVYISELADASKFTRTATVLNNSTEVPGATVFSGTTANFIDIQPGDGDEITGLGTFQNVIIIFKQFSIYQMTFDDTGDPVVTPITNAAGCVSARSVKNVENDLYFLSREGIRVLGNEPNFFSSIRTNILSKRIEPTTNTINETSYAKSNAIYFNNQYLMSAPTTSSTISLTLVYNKQFQAWSKWNGTEADAFTKFVDSDNEQNLLFLTADGTQVNQFTPGIYTDDGVPIRAYLLSKVFDFKNPDITKYFVDLGLMFRTISGQVDLEVYTEGNVLFGGTAGIAGNPVTDGMGMTMLGYTMLGLGGGTEAIADAYADLVRRVVINTNSTTIRFRIENARNNENFVLLGYINAFYPYGHYLFDSTKKIYL
jgi:hypothetical protein